MRRLIAITIAIAAATAVIYYADFTTVAEAVGGMSWITLVSIVALMAVAALARGYRWAFYLRGAGLNISWKDGITSYLASMTASGLPGGSVLAARLAQEHGDIRMRQAAPALFVQYVADAIAVASISFVAILATGETRGRLFIPLAGFVVAALLVSMGRSERVWKLADRLLGHFRLTREWLPKEADIHERVNVLMRPTIVAAGVGLSAITTALSVGLLIAFVNGLTVRGIWVREAIMIHATAETVSVVAPVGFLFSLSDSSLAGMLNSLGIGWVRVVFILIAMRSLGLIFKTLLGVAVLLTSYRPLLASALSLRRRARTARRHAGTLWGYSCDIATGRTISRAMRRWQALTRHAPRRFPGEERPIMRASQPRLSSITVREPSWMERRIKRVTSSFTRPGGD